MRRPKHKDADSTRSLSRGLVGVLTALRGLAQRGFLPVDLRNRCEETEADQAARCCSGPGVEVKGALCEITANLPPEAPAAKTCSRGALIRDAVW
jgi:hypothetical protein